MRKILTIAGSDSGGGAGIQADIKTISAHKMFAMSAITAITAQNSRGVFGVLDVSPDFVEAQLDAIFSDIFPDAVKIGMISNEGVAEAIAKSLSRHGAKNVVLDPVMVATSGGVLMKKSALHALKYKLAPAADIITPNVREAEVLAEMKILSLAGMRAAAVKISQFFGGAILIKGGDLAGASAACGATCIAAEADTAEADTAETDTARNFNASQREASENGARENSASSTKSANFAAENFTSECKILTASAEPSFEQNLSAAPLDDGFKLSSEGEDSRNLAVDILYENGKFYEFSAPKISTRNTHGTGCTLSSAIACALAAGLSLPAAVAHAKGFVRRALGWGEQIGHGCGAIDHYFTVQDPFGADFGGSCANEIKIIAPD
ncbi:bifunctional hydroxymethylpyrimidine kinase/phosphomethylpyrimidine kinase [uncultured Campylobacter sp.]|uniref:bifunctional hydroxymethylpyrimidine kinase/phosphomethylpyrimidine kinase n=1 Tax=uncultured Campylobacter sp. TaxID=218934 RepID=UPI00261CE5C9|nr:bifunctional hydroxymethylpyrimidine kinase/phosphomethylpyrimidine kinase [uncultured Campylobacter sp.]